ncbi:hypothetical protein P12x_004911 [Tundrisphaera lichenicola]|uniref:hypothetical protein n=1 Tax=Tundrisphaera lichenicola TaxID=2029860 RepID=UPI003EBCB94F
MIEPRTIHESLSALKSLGDVLKWAQARTHAAEFVQVVGMDEFTNDVVLRITPELYAVFDST